MLPAKRGGISCLCIRASTPSLTDRQIPFRFFYAHTFAKDMKYNLAITIQASRIRQECPRLTDIKLKTQHSGVATCLLQYSFLRLATPRRGANGFYPAAPLIFMNPTGRMGLSATVWSIFNN